jgi:hypothetical protein
MPSVARSLVDLPRDPASPPNTVLDPTTGLDGESPGDDDYVVSATEDLHQARIHGPPLPPGSTARPAPSSNTPAVALLPIGRLGVHRAVSAAGRDGS